MYRHEILSGNGQIVMNHYRDGKTASGLALSKMIGLTVAIRNPRTFNMRGMLLPPSMFSGDAGPQRSEPIRLPEITCHDLSEFVSTSISRWAELLHGIEPAPHFGLGLVEKRKNVEEKTASGLIVAADMVDVSEEKTEFEAYIALPDEIEAMERIASAVASSIDGGSSTFGLYM